MTGKLKRLGLVLVAVAALAAVGASAAQAGEFTAENYAATITGNQISKHTFKFEAGTDVCTVATFHGTQAAAAETLTLNASYENCATPNGGAAVGVTMNSC